MKECKAMFLKWILNRTSKTPEPCAECAKLRATLKVATKLISKHHNGSQQVRPGEMCPHCCDKDGNSPELDQIWEAITQKKGG